MELKKVSIYKTALMITALLFAGCNQKASTPTESNTEKSATTEVSQQKPFFFLAIVLLQVMVLMMFRRLFRG